MKPPKSPKPDIITNFQTESQEPLYNMPIETKQKKEKEKKTCR